MCTHSSLQKSLLALKQLVDSSAAAAAAAPAPTGGSAASADKTEQAAEAKADTPAQLPRSVEALVDSIAVAAEAKAKLKPALALLRTVISNILAHPTEGKYRKLAADKVTSFRTPELMSFLCSFS